MNSIGNNNIYALFAAIPRQQAQLDVLAGSALSRGIDLYQKGNYEGAATEFRRSIGLAPYSADIGNTTDFLVQSLLRLNRTDEAVKTYQDAIRLDPTNDSLHLNLGNVYFSLGRYSEARAEYVEAVRIDPASALNRYSLGQVQMQSGELAAAEATFRTVAAQSPRDENVMFALGQTYRRMGRFTEATDQLKAALSLDGSFSYARLELGFSYADMKDFGQAQDQVDALAEEDGSLALELSSYIYQRRDPRMLVAYSPDGFPSSSGPGTGLTELDPSLSTPGASHEFTMNFIFSKEMDAATVTNPAYWNITRSDGRDVGSLYNWGLPVAETEALIDRIPLRVVYDQDEQTATVTFRVTQNASGDATLDPSHLVFRFLGRDAYGFAMDSSADQYSGISLIV